MAQSPLIPRSVPEVLGPFRIVSELGSGGMGTVFLAERIEDFSQQVAIKILHPHLFPGSAEAATEREGEILAALSHPGIVRMLDAARTPNGQRYLVMEYVNGLPVDVYCDRHRLTIPQRLRLLIATLEAVEYAHRHFVVHADLKPENILVDAEGKPHLLDFGVAAMVTEAGSDSQPPQEGHKGFTALYCSPEQRLAERLTLASDLYSLGLIAQKVLIGLAPLPVDPHSLVGSGLGASTRDPERVAESILRRLRHLNPTEAAAVANARRTSVSGLLAQVRGDIGAILAKALAANPRERFLSAQEIADEFQRHLLGYPIQIRPASSLTRGIKWVQRNRLAAAFGFLLVSVLLLSLIGVAWQATAAARKRQAAETQLHDLVRLTDSLAGELYGSLKTLPGSDAAQKALLDSAHETIQKLAVEEEGDPVLQLELVAEYDKLARLELSREPLTREALAQSAEDVDREMDLLRALSASDGSHPGLRSEVLRLSRMASQTADLKDAALRSAR